MVIDETVRFRKMVSTKLDDAIEALTVLNAYFGRETLSTAIGELSELLVADYCHAKRTKRGAQGYDLIGKNGELIEVKSRFLSHYADRLQFNFRRHTSKAHTAFCMVWVADDGERPKLEVALKVSVPFLIKNWAKPNQPKYSARTTLGALRRSVGS